MNLYFKLELRELEYFLLMCAIIFERLFEI